MSGMSEGSRGVPETKSERPERTDEKEPEDTVGDGTEPNAEGKAGDVDELAEPESGLAVGNARSGDRAELGDCGKGSGEFEGRKRGRGVCEEESEDRVRLGDVDSGPVGSRGATWSRCEL